MNVAQLRWPTPNELQRDGTFACLDFVNSEWTDWRGMEAPTDRLSSPRWWKGFLARWGFHASSLSAPSGTRLADLRKLRSIMRSAIERSRQPSSTERAWLNRRLAVSPQRWAISRELETRIVPMRPGWPAVTSTLILSFSQLLNEADRSRLKKCDNPDCSYLFYDVSSNRSRRWCFANVCGNLMHVRAFRARRN